jgi:putative aldouronate transport system permease protein
MKSYIKLKKIEFIDILSFIILTIIFIFIVFPFYNAIITSLISSKSYTHAPVQLIPKKIILDNYRFIFGNSRILTGYISSIIVSMCGVCYGMLLTMTLAYGLSRDKFPGKRFFLILMIVTMYFSGGLLPTYILMKNLGFIDSRLGIILLLGVSPFNVIILKNSIENLPESLEEAACIDGANSIRIFAQIVVPLMKPMIATFSLFIAVAYWNEWFWSMLLLNNKNKYTLQLVLRSIVLEAEDSSMLKTGAIADTIYADGIKMAAVVVTMLPIMLVYPFVQKYFAKGLLIGAVKM